MSLTKQQVTALYIAVYNRAPDAAGLTYWTTDFTGTYEEAAAGFVSHPLFAAEYGDLTNQEKVEQFYTNILGSDGDTDGIDYWVGRLDAGEDVSVILSEFLDISLTGDFSDDPAAQARQDTLKNKVEVGIAYAAKMGDASNMSGKIDPNSANIVNDPAFINAQKVIANVDNTNQSVVAAMAIINDLVANIPGETQYLEVDRDVLTGTDNADKFIADIATNPNGQQVNTLGSGDRLDGGLGNDSLIAEVTAGAYVGGGNQQIQPKTVSVENIILQSVASNIGTGEYQGEGRDTTQDQVYVNAKDMLGVDYIGSERSNADLIVTDLTSKDNNGDMRDTADMTIGMKYTGNSNSRWDESDFKVYFDQDYLTRDVGFTRPSVDINVMNEDAYDETDGKLPLAGVFLRELTVTVNGEAFDLTQYITEDPLGNGEEITTYPELLAAIQNAIVDLQNDNPDNAALQTLEAKINGHFYADIDPDTGVRREGDSIRLSVAGESDGQKNTLHVESTDLELARTTNANYENNNRFERADNDPALPQEKLVSVKVDLEKAGLAGDGGELVIGSMNKGSDNNVWDAVTTVGEGTVSGVEQFNVTVSGDKSQSSSLSGLRSTNNNLREVKVVSAVDSDANLTIGNSNTGGLGSLNGNARALKDVQTFDASGFNGDLTLHAALTDQVTAKYMDLRDQQANPAADNFEFAYTGGKNNDTIDLVLDSSNLASAGTTTREDFSLTVEGGGGDDTIYVSIQDGSGLASTATPWHWYANSKINANLNIEGGDGNDTVYIQGGGDWIVNLGAGDDVVYAGNSGNPTNAANNGTVANQGAIWVFNTHSSSAADRNLDDLLSAGRTEFDKMLKTTISVSLEQGNGTFTTKKVEVPTDSDFNATDLQINQAIKEAINTDSVLSKLLVAEDGPSGALVVKSLIDGMQMNTATNDLVINWEAPTSLTLSEINQYNNKFSTSLTEAGVIAAITADITGHKAAPAPNGFDARYDAEYATDGSNEYKGSNSDFASDNIIIGGAGDDVIVLGTAGTSNDTVKYEGFDNDFDTVINFTAGATPGDFAAKDVTGGLGTAVDFLDLRSYEAKYVDFGSYTLNVWSDTNPGSSTDIGGITLSQNEVFLRVDDGANGVYTVEAWKVTASAGVADVQIAPNADIEKLGTIGTFDLGFDAVLNVDNFII